MAFFIRKILEKTACLSCSSPEKCHHECYIPPLVHPPPVVVTSEYKYHMPVYFILMLGVLGAAFVFICYMIILKRNRSNSRIRRNIDPQLNETREDFIDENLGPVVDHPIWYIRTVGLPQEIIDSITVFQYKKGEALVEGTDCSVCLTEFEEDDSLRLLPKCSHAFHVPCIDTWLRSHKNCPLCRAPIVSNVPQVSNVLEVAIANRGDESSPSEVDQVENGMRNDQLENVEEGNHETSHGVENLEDLRTDEERMMDLSMKIPRLVDERTKGVRVFSDLNDLRVKVENELQPSRRSVSMDSSAAAQVILGNIEGCSSSSDQQGKRKSLEIVTKKGNSNSSLYKAMKSSSFGRSLQKVPISMKRSFSTNAKWSSLPTTSKIQDLRQSM